MSVESDIPAPRNGVAVWRQPYRLTGVAGALLFKWNVVAKGWTIDFYDGQGNHLAGPRLVNNRSQDLFGGLHHLPVPPGRLVCRSIDHIPDFDAFGDTASLVYISP